MASDAVLVLRSEHRELLTLVDQCSRPARGFQDPHEELRRRLAAHLAAAEVATHPVVPPLSAVELQEALHGVRAELEEPTAAGAAPAATALVAAERAVVIPRLAALPIAERRRIGKVFRIKRETALRHAATATRRQRSQTELYELARRAGVEQRSRMTLAQLEAAVSAWERAHPRQDP